MISPLLLAIDPGKSGGLAIRYPDGKSAAWAMPDTDADTLDLFRELVRNARRENWTIQAAVEKVGGYCGKGQPGSSMFRFGNSYGFLVGVLMAFEVPVVLVRPQQWQAVLQLGKAADHGSKPAWKRHLRAEAARRFPHLRPTLSTADALLILEAMPAFVAGAQRHFGPEAETGTIASLTAESP